MKRLQTTSSSPKPQTQTAITRQFLNELLTVPKIIRNPRAPFVPSLINVTRAEDFLSNMLFSPSTFDSLVGNLDLVKVPTIEVWLQYANATAAKVDNAIANRKDMDRLLKEYFPDDPERISVQTYVYGKETQQVSIPLGTFFQKKIKEGQKARKRRNDKEKGILKEEEKDEGETEVDDIDAKNPSGACFRLLFNFCFEVVGTGKVEVRRLCCMENDIFWRCTFDIPAKNRDGHRHWIGDWDPFLLDANLTLESSYPLPFNNLRYGDASKYKTDECSRGFAPLSGLQSSANNLLRVITSIILRLQPKDKGTNKVQKQSKTPRKMSPGKKKKNNRNLSTKDKPKNVTQSQPHQPTDEDKGINTYTVDWHNTLCENEQLPQYEQVSHFSHRRDPFKKNSWD